MEISAGSRIDRYLLVEPLGEGGQGSVWKAMDALDASRAVALKLVPIAQAKPTSLERIRREARALAKLDHASLVRCHGLFEDFNASVLGLVLDLVDGQSLADALDDPRFTPELRRAVLEHVARALAHLHERHIVHRDLKPENIVLSAGFWSTPHEPSTVKIIDFGIAAEEGNPNPLTAYGNVIGTPAYMAPELIDATYFAGGRPTPAVDVFAFGVVAWILLVGGHPTGLPAESTLVDYAMEYRKVVTGQRTWLGDAPAFVVQCIEPRPERRLQTGSDVVSAMRGKLPSQEKATVAIAGQRGTLEGAPAPELFGNQSPFLSATVNESEPLRRGGVPPAPPLATRQRRDRSGLAIAVLIGVLVSCIGIVLLVFGLAPGKEQGSSATTKPGAAAPVPPRDAAAREEPAPQPATAVTGVTEEPVKAGPALPKACKAGDELCMCCPSGRTCGAGGCSALLQPGEQFSLRLWSVHRKPGVATGAADGVCVGRVADPSSQVCSTVGETYGGAVPAALAVTTHDLTRGGLVIQLTAGGRTVERRDAKHDAITRAALCDGLTFGGFGDAAEASARVTFYLDQRGETVRRACVLDHRQGLLSRHDRDAVRSPRAWSAKCFEHVNAGNFAWAKAACERARQEPDPQLVESSLQYNLGLVERGFGNKAAAHDYFSKSLLLREHAEVRAALNALGPL